MNTNTPNSQNTDPSSKPKMREYTVKKPLDPKIHEQFRKEIKHGTLYETVRTVVIAVLIALLVRTFAFEPFSIPSESMVPTLLKGDFLFVSKFSYGYSRHSFPLSFPLFEGRQWFESPQRGDVAVFKLPSDNRTDYIKRVIGLPGDKIQVIDGVLHINHTPVPRKLDKTFPLVDMGRPYQVSEYTETLPNGVSYKVWDREPDGPLDNTPMYEVPPGHYFMMGDNRDNSTDSRVIHPKQVQNTSVWATSPTHRPFVSDRGVGFVPALNLVGRADFIFFSLEKGVSAWEIWKWPWSIRYSRLFNNVD